MRLGETDLPGLERVLRLAMRRVGNPEDLGNAVLYVVSPASGWVSDQILAVDGGM